MSRVIPLPEFAAGPPQPARVVELVGPAASGKTSLLVEVAGREPEVEAGLRIPRHRHVAPALALAPIFLALHRPYRGLMRKEMKRITYLSALHRVLQERKAARARPVILDEGAVYMLARLLVLGGDRVRGAAFEHWWQSAIQRWAATLDLIVWLDAPDAVLRERLRARRQSHLVKQSSDEAIDKFMATYRAAYQRVMGALTEAHGPRVLTVRTDQEPVAHIAQRLLTQLGRSEGGVR
ncbi:MAG: AAA family ATPase [Gemmatimonadales bacterium]